MVAYTPNKNLALPTVAGDSGVWGGELNTSTTTPLDLMLGGANPVTLASVNYTLNSSDIQYLTQKLTGAIGANIVVYSSCLGFYFVENNTTGAFTVTWQANFGSGNVGTGWIIPQGTRTLFLSDTTAGARPVTASLGWLGLEEIATPAVPASGSVQIYGYAGDYLASQTPGGIQRIYGKDPTVQTFTSGSGTYTPAVGVVRIRVTMCGGGSGSSGSGSGATQGGAGAATIFGSWTAIGGAAPGIPATVSGGGLGGTGGADGTGTLIWRQRGQSGGASGYSGQYFAGTGGSSALGFGTLGSIASGATAGDAPGAGASGIVTNITPAGGGAGAGAETVCFWVSVPAATSYTVGAGGTAGAGSSTPGAPGHAGQIIVEEFYS